MCKQPIHVAASCSKCLTALAPSARDDYTDILMILTLAHHGMRYTKSLLDHVHPFYLSRNSLVSFMLASSYCPSAKVVDAGLLWETLPENHICALVSSR